MIGTLYPLVASIASLTTDDEEETTKWCAGFGMLMICGCGVGMGYVGSGMLELIPS